MNRLEQFRHEPASLDMATFKKLEEYLAGRGGK
jgi:hypothetical protein